MDIDEILLLNYLEGKCDADEVKQVEAWCEESPEHRRVLEQLYCTLFVADRVAMMDAVDTEASLQQLKSKMHAAEKKERKKRFRLRWKRYTAMAAAFVAGVALTGGVLWVLVANRLSEGYEVITAAGQRAQTVLPDGSKVWLNTSSHLVYHRSLWESERKVELTGEAYFEVAHDEHKPFIVSSQRIKTCVLGTKFDVRARTGENRVVTTLLEGAVKIDSPRTEEGHLLKPGQTLSVDTHTYEMELMEYEQPKDVLLWISGKLRLEKSSLQEITHIMEQLYDVKFVYKDERLKSERFTGEFSTDSTPEEILNVLAHTHWFKYKRTGRLIQLQR